MKISQSKNQGFLLIQTLVFGAVAVVVISGLIAQATSTMKLGRRAILSEQAFQIAEAGLEYYRWHLAHAPADFTDGTGGPGPYVKNFYDRNGVLLGTYTLTITPPGLGSTLLSIRSDGRVSADASVRRSILARLSIPSFANYAAITDSAMRFGEGTEVFGPVHSNNGLRFDGLAHNLVTSAVSSYNDADHTGNNEFGVHTHVNVPPASGVNDSFRAAEAPPSAVPSRPDVFLAGRSFPAPSVNFSVITDDLEDMETEAVSAGYYRGSSGDEGYRLVLKTNDTFDLYRVDSLQSLPGGCSSSGQTGWGSWTVNGTTFLGNYAFPANGLIFLEDHVWVEGTVDGGRLTIVAARIPDPGSASTRKSIAINSNILYTNYDGTDALALIGQNNVNVGMNSATNLKIDAALVAQHGRVGRYLYESDCSPYHNRSSITLYGSIVTSQRYGFAYVDGSGYATRTIIYDAHLLYTPPPFFPQTAPFYDVISWKEVE